MPEQVTLRPLRWWDIETIIPLEQQLFSPDTWSAETFWAELAAGHTYRLAAAGEQVVGYAGLAVAGATADVQTIAVAPAAQGTGVGRLLLTALVDLAREQGASELLLEVRADNLPAQKLYSAFGFARIAVRRRYYQPGDIDAHIMRLRPLPTSTEVGRQRDGNVEE